jgi:hypothetical protein
VWYLSSAVKWLERCRCYHACYCAALFLHPSFLSRRLKRQDLYIMLSNTETKPSIVLLAQANGFKWIHHCALQGAGGSGSQNRRHGNGGNAVGLLRGAAGRRERRQLNAEPCALACAERPNSHAGLTFDGTSSILWNSLRLSAPYYILEDEMQMKMSGCSAFEHKTTLNHMHRFAQKSRPLMQAC